MSERGQDFVMRIRDDKNMEHKYVQAVVLVNTKHPDGSPALCTFIQQHQKIDLAGGEEFMVVWAPMEMVRPRG